MTFYDTIEMLLGEINIKLSSPINVVIYLYDANYLNLELEERSIDKILHDKMNDSEHLSIEWVDESNKINIQTLGSHNPLTTISSEHDYSIEEHLKQYTYIGTIKDSKYKIYTGNTLKHEIEVEKNGFLYKEYFAYYEQKYEFDKITLPHIDEYKYKNLYTYKNEDEFTNAILVEFILRQIRYNNLLPSQLTGTIHSNESETEEELELKIYNEIQDEQNKVNDKLVQYFGLTYEEVHSLQQVNSHWYTKALDTLGLNLQIKHPPSATHKHETVLTLSDEVLIEQTINLKKNFDNEINSCINLKQRLNKAYLNKAYKCLEKFPLKFETKQKQLILALFIFDYIQARKLNIDEENIKSKNEPLENEKEYKSNIIEYPKMDPKYKDSFFSEITQIIKLKRGQAKKIHSHIHKFLELQIP